MNSEYVLELPYGNSIILIQFGAIPRAGAIENPPYSAYARPH